MKSKRSAISLHMLFSLMEKKSFTAESIMDDLDISRSSFFRALSDFRCYLLEYRPDIELQFDERKDVYYLDRYNSESHNN